MTVRYLPLLGLVRLLLLRLPPHPPSLPGLRLAVHGRRRLVLQLSLLSVSVLAAAAAAVKGLRLAAFGMQVLAGVAGQGHVWSTTLHNLEQLRR